MKKKLLTLVLAAAMALSFAACGSDGNGSANNNGSSSAAQASAPSAESSASAGSGSQAEDGAMTLADWLETDEAKQAEEATNSALASTGMSVKLAADGNVFIYEYTLPGGDEYSGLTTEALADAFDPVIEANKQGLTDLFTSFEDSYGIKLDGARFVFLTSDGKELYSGDVANE